MKLALILLTFALIAVINVSAITVKDDLLPSHTASHYHTVKHASSGGGEDGHSKKVGKHKHYKKSGSKSAHVHEKAHKGQEEKTLHKIDDEESGGKKSKNYAKGGYGSNKHGSGHSKHGAKFKSGAKQAKSNFSKGFREKFGKDESIKHDRFYSNSHKSGEFKVFGAKGSKFHSHKHDKSEHSNHKSGKHADKYGKAGKSSSGHDIESAKGHNHETGGNTAYSKNSKWGKKGHHNHDNSKKLKKYVPIK